MIAVNVLIVLITIGCMIAYSKRSPMPIVLRYFTPLSNILCALSCALVAIFRMTGNVPQAVLLFKYAGTVSVTVTFMTCLLFLGPFVCGYKVLLTGPDLFMHLINPVLALISYFAWDKPQAPFISVFLGVLPMLLYGLLYLSRVVFAREGTGWDDFYAFNRGGHWPLSFVMMTIGTFLISVLLWAI